MAPSARLRRAQVAHEVDAVHLRHVPVGDHEIDLAGAQAVEALASVPRFEERLVAELGQGVDDDAAHRGRIIDNEEAHSGPVLSVESSVYGRFRAARCSTPVV